MSLLKPPLLQGFAALANLSLRSRIFGLTFISLALTASLGGVDIYFLHELGMEIRALVETNMPISRTLSGVKIYELDHAVLLMQGYSDSETNDERQRHLVARDKFYRYLEEVDQELTLCQHMVATTVDRATFPEYSPYFQEVTQRLLAIRGRHHQLVLLIKKTFSHLEVANAVGWEETARLIQEEKSLLLEEIRSLLLLVQETTASSLQQMGDKHTFLLKILPWALGVIMLFIFMLARVVIYQIVGPLHRAIATTQALVEDNVTIHVSPMVGGEMGQLLRAMDHLAETMGERDDLRKRLAVSEKMSSIGRLAVGVAHEINNPLASASVGLQNLQTRLKLVCQEQEILRKFQQVEGNIQRAARVAREMLEFAYSGVLEGQKIAICSELDGIIEQYDLAERGVRLQRAYHVNPTIWGDEVKIGRIFSNLLDNALDAMVEGGVLTVTVTQRFPQWVIVTIGDTGVGIAGEYLSKVLEPFFTTKQVGKGTGLGLPICLSLVEQHRGRMEINSTLGRGTTVVVSLPAWRERP